MDDILDSLDFIDEEDVYTASEEDVFQAGTELAEIIDDEISPEDARHLTDTIKATATATYLLVAEAHERKAYKALGYDTWQEYVKQEFDISASWSYQLISQANVIKEIEAVAPENVEIKLSEAQARSIKQRLPEITEKIKEGTSGMSTEEASAYIDSVIAETRELEKAEKKAKEAREKELADAKEAGFNEALEAVADQMLEADGLDNASLEADQNRLMGTGADNTFFEMEVDGNKPEPSFNISETMNYHNLINSVNTILSLPGETVLADSIPYENKRNMLDNVLDAIRKLEDLANALTKDLE